MPMPAQQTRQIARDALKGNWATALGVAFVAALLGGTSNGFASGASSGASNAVDDYGYGYGGYYSMPTTSLYAILGFLGVLAIFAMVIGVVSLILGGAVRQGLCQYNINLVTRREPPQFNNLFSKFNNFGKALLLNLVMSLFIFLWSLLFIIPGIIAAYRYAMAPYIMAQNPDIGVMDAIKASKEMMQGNKGKLFCLELSFIGWILLAMCTCGIGMLWVNPYMYAAEATFYLNLTGQLPGQPYAAYPAQPGYAPPPQGYDPGQQAYAPPPQPGYAPQQPGYDPNQQAYAPPQQYTQPQPGYAPPPPAYQPPADATPPPPGGTYPPPPTDDTQGQG